MQIGSKINTNNNIYHCYIYIKADFVFLGTNCLKVTAFLARPNKTSKVRKYWNWGHHNFGRLAIAFAIANIFLGLSLAEESNSWYVGYGVFLGIWVVTAILLEVRHWMRSDH
jgi:hypothetical protein